MDENSFHSSTRDFGLDNVDNEVMKIEQDKELSKESVDGKKECDHALSARKLRLMIGCLILLNYSIIRLALISMLIWTCMSLGWSCVLRHLRRW